MAMAGERLLSTGYSLSREKVQMDTLSDCITYKHTAKRKAQAVCGHFLSFYIFVFPLLLIRDLVHETGDSSNATVCMLSYQPNHG